MENENLVVQIENNVMKIVLNRPKALNAFNKEMLTGMIRALDMAETDSGIRVVTIQGSGRAFSAGGDVKSMGDREGIGVYEHLAQVSELIKKIRNLGKPVIAIVHGYAAGVAFSISLACDLIIAEEDSKFIMSFAKVGLISDGGASFFLPRLIGAQRAKELLFTAQPLTATKAYEWGIVNRIYSSDDFDTIVKPFVDQLANGPGKSYEMVKKLVNQSFASDLDEILELERLTQALMVYTTDHKEGVSAFKEKREPVFSGK